MVVVEDGDGLDLGEVSGHGGVALANEVGVVEVGVREETEVAVLLAVEVEGDAVGAYETRILADAAGLVTSYSSPEKKQIRIYLYDVSEYYILYITCIIVGSVRKFYYLIINSVSTLVKCYCSKIVNLFSKMTSKKLPSQILLAQYFQNRKKKKGGKKQLLTTDWAASDAVDVAGPGARSRTLEPDTTTVGIYLPRAAPHLLGFADFGLFRLLWVLWSLGLSRSLWVFFGVFRSSGPLGLFRSLASLGSLGLFGSMGSSGSSRFLSQSGSSRSLLPSSCSLSPRAMASTSNRRAHTRRTLNRGFAISFGSATRR